MTNAFTFTETTTYAPRPRIRPAMIPCASIKFKPRNHLRRLTEEVTHLRAKSVEARILSTAKDEAMRDYVNGRISEWNSVMRSMNGPRPGETAASYSARLVAANSKE